MNEPFARNADFDTTALPAVEYLIGGYEGELVVSFTRPNTPSLACFFNQEDAVGFLGRFTQEMKEKGWLS